MNTWFVYMVECWDGSLYTGISTDPKKRLVKHNQGNGAKYFFAAKRPAKLVYVEGVFARGDAGKREYEVKQMGRERKLSLINSPINQVENWV